MTSLDVIQLSFPAVFMRGGTSKAIIFHEKDLPASEAERHWIYLRAMGSPDENGRQLDGLGGGVSSLSKVCVIAKSPREDADINYTFVQIPVLGDQPDHSANCGNMSSAVGPFAVEERLVEAKDGQALVRIYNTNTDKIIESRFEVRNHLPVVEGAFINPGVAGQGAKIQLDFIDPGGAGTGHLLPSGAVLDQLEVPGLPAPIQASMIDVTNAVVYVPANQLGLSGYELPDELDGLAESIEQLENIRRVASVRMGLTKDLAAAGQLAGSPKVALVAPPREYKTTAGQIVQAGDYDVSVRIISMGQAHRAITLTGAMCTAAACSLNGSCVAEAANPRGDGPIRIGHASGITEAMATVNDHQGMPGVERTTVFRTARRLMEGRVRLPRQPKKSR